VEESACLVGCDVAHEGGDRGLRLAVGGAQRGVGVGLVDLGHPHDDPAGAVPQLVVGGLHVDHEVAVGLAGADHHSGRQRVEHRLLRRPGLEPRRPGEGLGAGGDLDRVRHRGAEQRRAVAGHADGERAGASGGLDGSQGVGGPAAGADRDQRVVGAQRQGRHLVLAGLLVVLGPFGGDTHRTVRTAGEQS
jgi:hypothetical protein